MIDWKKLCEDSHRIVKDKGWLDKPRQVEGDIILMHSEISEALEDYRTHRSVTETYYEDKGGTKFPSLELAEKTSLSPNKKFKPCGIPIELADYVIRICQFSGSNGIDLPYAMHMYRHMAGNFTDFEKLCAKLHWCTSKAYEHFDETQISAGKADPNHVDEFYFARALNYLMDFCTHHKIDLKGAIECKQAYNEGREYRHGDKKI